jgi:hypothetical protein
MEWMGISVGIHGNHFKNFKTNKFLKKIFRILHKQKFFDLLIRDFYVKSDLFQVILGFHSSLKLLFSSNNFSVKRINILKNMLQFSDD